MVFAGSRCTSLWIDHSNFTPDYLEIRDCPAFPELTASGCSILLVQSQYIIIPLLQEFSEDSSQTKLRCVGRFYLFEMFSSTIITS